MTDEKRHVDLSKIEPVFRGVDPEDDLRETRQDVDREGDDGPPPDPDELDRLRRG